MALGIGLQQIKLTEQEHNCDAAGEFQNVPLFGLIVESTYLIVTRNHVEPTLQRNPTNGGGEKRRQANSRGQEQNTSDAKSQ